MNSAYSQSNDILTEENKGVNFKNRLVGSTCFEFSIYVTEKI